jgi:ATP-dependent helicase/nuclease subunit A
MPGNVRLARWMLVPVDLRGGGVTQLELLGGEGNMDEFSEEQLEAIELREGSLFLQAGAGSGKTRVLAERFVRAVRDDGVAVDAILAITFTEKAAAELKERIRGRFVGLGERDRAREAESAWIGTIHGFCSRVLRTHSLAAGLDPEYQVLDEIGAERLAVDAFDRGLEEFLERGTRERVDLAAAYGADKLARMVRTVHSRLRSRGEREPRLPPIEPPRLGQERVRLESALAAARSELAGVDGGSRIEEAFERMDRCGEALGALAEDQFGDPDVFANLEVKKGAGALKTPVFDALREAHAAWLGACRAHKEHQDYGLLSELVELHDLRYTELKESSSALDFEDLELRARDLLRSDTALCEQYRQRFAHVMVDEYQDTNELQNSILDLIARDNLFTVGDEQQSIYLFRNADVSVFRRRREEAEKRGRLRRLTQNFRTRREVLDVLNPAFTRVFDGHFQPLRAQEPEGPPPASPSVDLLVVDWVKKRWTDLAEARGTGEGNGSGDAAGADELFGFSLRRTAIWRAAEARLLAKRVDQLTRGGPFEYGDAAVLLRAATDMSVYERALAERGLPTYAIGGRGYWGQQQTADLRAYLAALANPLDEMALYNLLATPLAGLSLDALVLVRVHAKALGRSAWWALEQAFAPDGSEGLAEALPDADRERLGAFVGRLAAERRVAGRLSLETLIDRAVSDSGYDRAALAMPSGDRRMANVRKLMRLAREYEAENGRDLRGFIDLLDEQDLMQAREGEAPLEAEGQTAIRLMTIHAAKGLEFPLVCVADLGREGRGDDAGLQVTEDGRAGLRIASMAGGAQDSEELEHIRKELNEEHDAEERRIFYVAMTRSQQHLVVSGALDLEKWPEPKPLGYPMAWAARAIVPEFEKAAPSAAEGVAGGVRWLACSPATLDQLLGPGDRRPSAPEAGEAAEPVSRPGFPELPARAALPVGRLSYSALESYARCGYRFYLERVLSLRDWGVPAPAASSAPTATPAPAGEPEELTAAEGLPLLLRGSIVHELLERIDFARPELPDPERVAARIEAEGLAPLDPDIADVRDLVERFIDSSLRERLAAARIARRELPFAFTLDVAGEELLVNGVLDVHAAEERGALIVDYKSDRLEGRDPELVVEEQYATQRVVYALAGLRAGAPRTEVAYCFLDRPDEPVTATFEPEDVPALEGRLLELAGDLLAGRFEPTDAPHRGLCQFCPGQPALCSWEPERTLAAQPPV